MRLLLCLAPVAIAVTGCVSSAPIKLSWHDRTVFPSASATTLNDIANDLTRTKADRANAVFSLFANYVRIGDSTKEISRVFTKHRWIRAAQFSDLFGGDRVFVGWVPVADGLGARVDSRNIIRVDLFPHSRIDRQSDWAIYMAFSGPAMTPNQARAFLLGNDIEAGRLRLAEFALCLPNPSKSNLPGRIERFSAQGMHVYDSW